MSTPPGTPTPPPPTSPFGFTKLIEDKEKRSFDCPSLEDEIDEFTQTQEQDVPFVQRTASQVYLLPGHPVPPITPKWTRFRLDGAKDWEGIYMKRIQRWRELVSPAVITTDVIDL